MTAAPVFHLTTASPVRTGTIRIGFLSPHNPFDRRAFSGTVFHAAQALGRLPGVELRVLGHRPPGPLSKVLARRGRTLSDIDTTGLDAVVGLVATPFLDRLPPGIPFLHVTDATPAFLRDAYGWDVPQAADDTERRVAARAAVTVYSSNAIARRAAADLGLCDLTPAVVPFGVNFDRTPEAPSRKQSLNKPELLFVGKDWSRKGGEIALGALNRLRAEGIDAHLTIVGCTPGHLKGRPGVRFAGFLDKNRPRDAARLAALYERAHLLLLPSRGDCTPMVIAEALAHGTPVLASDTGGVADVLGAPAAGRILPLSAGPDDWAATITDLLTDSAEYSWLCEAGHDRARTRLSWDAWAEDITALTRMAATGVSAANAA